MSALVRFFTFVKKYNKVSYWSRGRANDSQSNAHSHETKAILQNPRWL